MFRFLRNIFNPPSKGPVMTPAPTVPQTVTITLTRALLGHAIGSQHAVDQEQARWLRRHQVCGPLPEELEKDLMQEAAYSRFGGKAAHDKHVEQEKRQAAEAQKRAAEEAEAKFHTERNHQAMEQGRLNPDPLPDHAKIRQQNEADRQAGIQAGRKAVREAKPAQRKQIQEVVAGPFVPRHLSYACGFGDGKLFCRPDSTLTAAFVNGFTDGCRLELRERPAA
jgi:hypothetical protein